jgi:hypothetical protein
MAFRRSICQKDDGGDVCALIHVSEAWDAQCALNHVSEIDRDDREKAVGRNHIGQIVGNG